MSKSVSIYYWTSSSLCCKSSGKKHHFGFNFFYYSGDFLNIVLTNYSNIPLCNIIGWIQQDGLDLDQKLHHVSRYILIFDVHPYEYNRIKI